MKLVTEACTPKNEVLHGELTESIFAADLQAVFDGTAPKVYQDPETFFEATYPTEGMRTILKEVFGRLTKADRSANPSLRLETSFGGGKTHTLIALYHIAKSSKNIPNLEKFLQTRYQPRDPVKVAVLCGTAWSPKTTRVSGRVRPKSICGEMAYQVGGPSGYEMLRSVDEEVIAPGTAALNEFFDGIPEPKLMLIDELAPYLSSVDPHTADATVSFIQQLLTVAGTREDLSVVLSLATKDDPYAGYTEKVRNALAGIRGVSARNVVSFTPSNELEISGVLRSRLFDKVDLDAAREAAEAYFNMYRELDKRGSPLPPQTVKADYKGELESAYPFHPDLLNVLNRKLGTIQQFNRTRGALKLLAGVIKDLWEENSSTVFIMPYHVDLSDEQIVTDLTAKLDKVEYRGVVQHDIYSKKGDAKAQLIDAEGSEKGVQPLARMVATTVYLNSLVQAHLSGLDLASINLSVLQPELKAERGTGEMEPSTVAKAVTPEAVEKTLNRLADSCWYLYEAGSRYVFRTEANINKMISEEEANVSTSEAKSRVETIVRKKYSGSHFVPVFFPTGSNDVPDDAEKPKLVLIHWDTETVASRSDKVPKIVEEIYERTGQRETFRMYKNNVLFLVADQETFGAMTSVAKRRIALENLKHSSDFQASLSDDQRKKLNEKHDQSEMELLISILTSYRHLYYPSSLGLYGSTLAHLELRIDKTADIKEIDCQKKVFEALVGEEKMRTADSKPISPQYIEDSAWVQGEEITIGDLRRRFAMKNNLPILATIEVLRKSIIDGIKQGKWVYVNGSTACFKDPSTSDIRMVDNAVLLTVEEARKRDLLAKEGKEGEGEVVQPPPPIIPEMGHGVTAQGEGDPKRAFRALNDDAEARKIKEFKSIRFEVGDAKSLGALERRIPQLAKSKTSVNLSCDVRIGSETQVNFSFQGTWEDYKGMKDLVERLIKMKELTVEAAFEVTLAEPLAAKKDVLEDFAKPLIDLGLQKVRLMAFAADAQKRK